MMVTKSSSDSNVYQSVALFLAGVVISGFVSYMAMGRNNVTKDELDKVIPALMKQNDAYLPDKRDISTQLQALHDEQVRQGAQQQQMAVDIGRISEKMGVTAHPATEH